MYPSVWPLLKLIFFNYSFEKKFEVCGAVFLCIAGGLAETCQKLEQTFFFMV
jgi:hypothetical protein